MATLATEKKKHKLLWKELQIKPPELDLDLEDKAGSMDGSNLLSECNDYGMSLKLSPIKSGKEHSREYKCVNAVEQQHSFMTSKHASIVQSTDMLHNSSEDEPLMLGLQELEELEDLEDEVLIDHRHEQCKETDTALAMELVRTPITMSSDKNKEAIVYKPVAIVDWVGMKGMARSVKMKNVAVVKQVELPMKDYAALASISSRISGNSSPSSSSSSESDSKASK